MEICSDSKDGGCASVLGRDVLALKDKSLRVPDWVQVLTKLKARIPDNAWQKILHYLKIGRSKNSKDIQLLLNKNMIRANKKLTFSVVRKTLGIEKLPGDLTGYGTVLPSVLVWALREARLHQMNKTSTDVVFNIKLDGRPLFGKEQVSVGLVPVDVSSESYDSVYPLAIANCKEDRTNLKALISKMNDEKKIIKTTGIKVDGIVYQIKFVVTVDLKALLLLIVRGDNEDFILGGKGLDVEFCMFCRAVRACQKHLSCGRFQETCLECLQSKANIGNWKGLRDDLSFLLDEELSSIQLCSLHQEMRNTEQLLGSLGLFANAVGCLDK
ncbi:uncharacterized protein LOC110236083 [Exaiptasia diaphana]|uniref:Uncharacterized protein n=1 Tax=Exaiptasia diaphana TaxID=2652724 RepID=A0A913YHJ6_EXADI|nr:uncharacterized protein LOC110236083 [Exaiptasia diaphana]